MTPRPEIQLPVLRRHRKPAPVLPRPRKTAPCFTSTSKNTKTGIGRNIAKKQSKTACIDHLQSLFYPNIEKQPAPVCCFTSSSNVGYLFYPNIGKGGGEASSAGGKTSDPQQVCEKQVCKSSSNAAWPMRAASNAKLYTLESLPVRWRAARYLHILVQS